MKPPSVFLTVSASHPAWVYKPAARVAVDRFGFSALAPVHPTTVPRRTVRCPRKSGGPLLLLHHWLGSVRRHTPEHLSDTPCRTAHRNESRAIPSLLRATPSATSERLMELLGSSPIPRSFVASCVRLKLRSLPFAGVTRLHRYYGPLRHPTRPGLALASYRLILTAISAGASRVASGLLGVHAIAITPAGSMEHIRSSLSIDCGLPCETVRSAPATVFSRPAQRLLTLWPARSPSRHATLSIESSDSFVASAAASIATGWSEPVPGREFHPLKSSAFHGALFRQQSL
jgi:hypothetical protein